MQAMPSEPALEVTCLCAAWCGVCRDWTPVFEELSAAFPQVRFGWVDVEDEAEAMGDVDVETFPTLLVSQGDRTRFLGPVQPSLTQVSRLVESMLRDPGSGGDAGPAATALLRRLKSQLLPKR